MAERVLSTAELNRAVLARQLLLERSELPRAAAVEQVAGLQTQYAPSGYVGLWSRLAGFGRDALTDALLGRARRPGLGDALHHPHGLGARLLAVHGGRARGAPTSGGARPERDRRPRHRSRRRRRARLSRRRAAQAGRDPAATRRRGVPPEAWSGVQLWVDLVRVPPAGTWDRLGPTSTALAPAPRPSSSAGRRARAVGRAVPARLRARFGQGRSVVLRVDGHDHARGAGPPGAAQVP